MDDVAVVSEQPVNTGEPSQADLNSQLFGEEAPAVQPQQTQPDMTAQIQQAINEALKQHLSPIQSQLGRVAKFQSEWDKQKTQTAAYQPPASWAELTPEVKKQTQEIIDAAWREKYGKQWDDQQSQLEEYQSTRKQQAVMTNVQRIAGKDFAELDDIMGNIYTRAKEASENGNQDATDFIDELFNTKSAQYRLVEMARAEFRGTREKQSQQAQTDQAKARNRASTAVQRASNNVTPAQDLGSATRIKDPRKRLEALQGMMDQQDS